MPDRPVQEWIALVNRLVARDVGPICPECSIFWERIHTLDDHADGCPIAEAARYADPLPQEHGDA